MQPTQPLFPKETTVTDRTEADDLESDWDPEGIEEVLCG